MTKETNPNQHSKSKSQTSSFVAWSGAFGTAFASPLAVIGYSFSNMAASNSPLIHIINAVRANPNLLFSSIKSVTAKLSLASTRILALPYANNITQSLPNFQQDLATAAIMSIAELPSAVAELFEVSKSSKQTYTQLLTISGKQVADNARLLVNLRSPSTWGLFFACTMLKNGPLNFVGAQNTRLANEAQGANNCSDKDEGSLKRVITATTELVISSTIAGAVLQGPLYRSARGYGFFELLKSIPNKRNIAVGAAKGVAHIPIGFFTFGAMELARQYEQSIALTNK